MSVMTAAIAIATDTTLTKIAILGFTQKMIMARHLLCNVPVIRSRPRPLCVTAPRRHVDLRYCFSIEAPFCLEVVLGF